jgi:Sec-independent protein translocase protein TatA
MELLGIGPLELLVIALIAILVFSPKDLAEGGKKVGRWINQLNRSDTFKSMRQVSQEMQNLPSRLAKEAQLDELKELEKGITADGGSKSASRSAAPPMPPAETPPPAPKAVTGSAVSAATDPQKPSTAASPAPVVKEQKIPDPYTPAPPAAKDPK